MGEIKLNHAIVAVENLLCIYRNFSSLRGCWKYLALIRVAIVFVVYLSLYFNFVISKCTHAEVTFCYLMASHASFSTIITLVAVSGGIGYTDYFEDLTTKMESVHKYCSNRDAYKKSLKNLTIAVAVCSSLFFVVYLIIFVAILWLNSAEVTQNNDIEAYLGLMVTLLSVWREFRFNVEFFIFNIFIKIMATLLNQLQFNLATILEIFGNSEEGIDDMTCHHVRKELEAWTFAYNNIALCSGQLKKCYGTEILVSLFILVLYLIVTTSYCVAVIAHPEYLQEDSIQPALILLGSFLLFTIILLYNGQEVKRKSSSLNELITRLHNKLMEVPGSNVVELRRLVKDFRRQMAVQPVNIKLRTKTTVEMSLLLLILSTAVSYTVILLQFNHVV